jgi:hypothetical protein
LDQGGFLLLRKLHSGGQSHGVPYAVKAYALSPAA